MNQPLRIEVSRLLNGEGELDQLQAYENITNTAFNILYAHGKSQVTNPMIHDAHLLFQITILKCLSILHLYQGFMYQDPINREIRLNYTIDPLSIWTLVRAQFESYCTFNNIYIRPTGSNESVLLFDLWVISGLKFRQRFESLATLPENISKAEKEKQEIEGIIHAISTNPLYLSLDEPNQQKIRKAIKDNRFQLVFNNNKVEKVSWQQMISNAGVNNSFDHMYTHLSLNTHPSNVAVFQFKDTFKNGHYIESSLLALKISRIIMCFFICDYCVYIKESLDEFNILPPVNQLLVNLINGAFRGHNYKLNDLEEYT